MDKYLKIFALSFYHNFRNYKSWVGLSFFLIVCLIVFSNLWKVLAAKVGVFDLNAKELLWYIAFNEWVLISMPHPEKEIEIDLRSGKLAYTLPRPMSYMFGVFSESMGTYCVNLITLGLAAFGFSWFQVGMPPLSLIDFPTVILTALFAGAVGVLLQMLVGLSAFWFHEVEPFAWIWEKLLFALGGLILPLSVYPATWQIVAHFTPFPYILGARSALVFENNFAHLSLVLLGLTIWGFVALGLVTFFYRKGLKILNIEGG